MNSRKIIAPFAVPLALLLLGGCHVTLNLRGSSAVSGSADRTQPLVKIDTSRFTGYGFQALKTDAERTLYGQIDYAVTKPLPQEFICKGIGSEETVSVILELYLDDHPDVFWIDYTSPYLYELYDDGSMLIEFTYSFSTEELINAKQAFSDKLREISDGAPQGAGDYEKELYAHDYLIDNCVYEDADTVNQQTAYGALVEGKAVCEGYARAFQLLCGELGLNAFVIQGDTDEDNDSMHIWNSVQLDGEWYQCDVTWDDSEEDPDYYEDRYLFFNLTTEQMLEEHTVSPLYGEQKQEGEYYNSFVPDCTATAYNYFLQNAVLIDDLENGAYAEHIARAAAEHKEYCDFLVDESLDFEETFDIIVDEYAYYWLTDANKLNGYSPSISDTTTLSALEMRRVVTFILRYE